MGNDHDTQQRCRDEVFQDYHLRVGESVRDTAPPAGGAIDLVEDHIKPGIRFVELRPALSETRNTPPPEHQARNFY